MEVESHNNTSVARIRLWKDALLFIRFDRRNNDKVQTNTPTRFLQSSDAIGKAIM